MSYNLQVLLKDLVHNQLLDENNIQLFIYFNSIATYLTEDNESFLLTIK